MLGYHVEVPAKHGDTLMREGSGFTHRQTLAGVVRFNSLDLHEQASQVSQAGAHAIAAEAAHLEELIEHVLRRKDVISRAAQALARLDVAAALAERAAEGGWSRPHFIEEQMLEISGGRHPVVEDALRRDGQPFVANDCHLSAQDRLWLVTGPNMGGKSTFLRQNALIVLMAQAGSFVPATSARLSLVDRLFSRVGASDNLARGRSTFMVEMVETAAILAQATTRSFVILDEVGRGTSTFDGLALAWAILEDLDDAADVLRTMLSQALLGEAPRWVYDFRSEGERRRRTGHEAPDPRRRRRVPRRPAAAWPLRHGAARVPSPLRPVARAAR